ncbi:hypothetical protein HK407_12g17980 [Ordospora pajunii]|uniref:uncharacterized protein n=1 Tax=Ordospora pajunii TaxID=3039483 RepID=UPI0029526580|nr:uncharacterized protein HK407_12g17980 [Ordospora pajunii]KAH9410666.1 hypothetical protein HK407_12g17980 [Ordospora pajunii]
MICTHSEFEGRFFDQMLSLNLLSLWITTIPVGVNFLKYPMHRHISILSKYLCATSFLSIKLQSHPFMLFSSSQTGLMPSLKIFM